VVSVKTAVG